MCVVSNTGDYWNQRWYPWRPYINTPGQLPYAPINPPQTTTDITIKPFTITPTGPTQADFDRLKEEVEMLKDQLKMAKEYDARNNEPNCEIEEKMALLKKIAKLVGVDLDEVLKPVK